MNIELLQQLCEASAVSGDEQEVRDILINTLEPCVNEITFDGLGSFVARKGNKGPKVAVVGHMDEVGFMVTHIDESGFLRFTTIGGWWNQSMLNHRVTIRTHKGVKIPGVIGSVAPHALTEKQRQQPLSFDEMFIDIGANSREEAEKRGLYNLKSLPDALPEFISQKNLDLFTKHHIFTKEEIFSRYEILLENYAKTIHIESLTLQDMVRKDFTPALFSYMADIASEALEKKKLLPSLSSSYEEQIIRTLTESSESISVLLEKLCADTKKAEQHQDTLDAARYYHDTILLDMELLRGSVDQAEAIIPGTYLPYPTYDELLFSLR